jgi:hypothetical protein
MAAKHLSWAGLAVLIGVLFAACAPVGQPQPTASTKPAEPIDPGTEVLPAPQSPLTAGPKARIEAAIDNARRRELVTSNGFWTVFHGILGLGPSLQLRHPETNERVNAMDYIWSGGDMRGLQFIPTKHGLDVQLGPTGIGQGHQDQFVAEMGQWDMPAERRVVVFGKDYTFMDFVRHSQMRASTSPTRNQELSWAVIVVGQYIGQDVSWTNMFGEKLHYEDMIRYELDASVENAACGGTHRLFGLSWSYHLHRLKGGKAEGVWKEVVEKTAKYRDLAKKYQNPDGAFSTNFFSGPGNSPDKSRRVNSTGHMLEWMALALSDDELKEPWVQEAANALALLILDLEGSPIEGGTIYHATHGLLMYYARVYGDREFLGANDPLIPLPPELKGKKSS